MEPYPKIGAEVREAILVVEDEVFIRTMIAYDLREPGYTVIEASNAQEALQALRDNGVDVRVMFSDVRIAGGVDGIALAREVRSQYPAIKIVLTSGYLPTLDWAKHEGFFLKPYDPAKVSRHIKTLLE